MGYGAGLYTRNATQRIVKRITLVCDLVLADFFLLYTISAKLICGGSFLNLVKYSRVTPLHENSFSLVQRMKSQWLKDFGTNPDHRVEGEGRRGMEGDRKVRVRGVER
jgi:hypothetical protein